MRSKILSTVALLIVAVFLLRPQSALGGPNPNKGKTLYKVTCKSCHVKGGEAKELTPISKTQQQWERFFKKGIDACLKKVLSKTGKELTPQDLEDMKFFLVSHAADSDHPETCGSN